MIKNVLFYILFSTSMAFGQEYINAPIKDSIALEANTFFGFDVNHALYFENNNTLIKKEADKTYNYQNFSLGKISRVDFFNPLNVLVFYESFNTIVLLDNQLNEIKTIHFSNLTTPILASAVAISSQNEIWFFDGLNQKIGLLNHNSLEVKFISNTILSPIKNYNSNYVSFFWIDANFEIYSINRYGVVAKLGNIIASDILFLSNSNCVFYYSNNAINTFNWKEGNTSSFTYQKKMLQNCFYSDGILATFTNPKITNFQIK